MSVRTSHTSKIDKTWSIQPILKFLFLNFEFLVVYVGVISSVSAENAYIFT